MRRIALLVLLLPACGPRPPARDVCSSRGTAIVVSTAARRLHLCEAGASVRSFPVQLGRGGTDKKREGDRKTPLGRYALAEPRASKYCTFLPIAYPTAEQSRAGYTGSAIGVHGPPKSSRGLGRLRRPFDWTRGCIAVAKKSEIDTIAAWWREKKPAEIVIE